MMKGLTVVLGVSLVEGLTIVSVRTLGVTLVFWLSVWASFVTVSCGWLIRMVVVSFSVLGLTFLVSSVVVFGVSRVVQVGDTVIVTSLVLLCMVFVLVGLVVLSTWMVLLF